MDKDLKRLNAGDLVMVTVSFLGNEPQRAFVYETYQDFDSDSENGVSLILENGTNLGGFSREEQVEYLEFIKSTRINYEFNNVIQLGNDFDKGVFKEAFL